MGRIIEGARLRRSRFRTSFSCFLDPILGSFLGSFSLLVLMVAIIAEAAFLRDVSGEIVVFHGRAVLETLRRVLKGGFKNGPPKTYAKISVLWH